MQCKYPALDSFLSECGIGWWMYVPENFESLDGLRREYAQSKARHLEEVRREAREAEEQAQLLQQDMQRKVRGCLAHKLRGVAST